MGEIPRPIRHLSWKFLKERNIIAGCLVYGFEFVSNQYVSCYNNPCCSVLVVWGLLGSVRAAISETIASALLTKA